MFSNHIVSVSKLVSGHGHAFLDVDEDIHGGIGVFGTCYINPTYLLKKGHIFRLVQFTSKDYANDWLEQFVISHKDYEIIRLIPEKKILE